MEDGRIVELFFARSEEALAQVKNKYGKAAMQIGRSVLHNSEDAEECANDAYLVLWNKIPPERPQSLCAFFLKIVRNIALNRYRSEHRASCGETVALEEIENLLPAGQTVDEAFSQKELTRLLENWLRRLNETDLYIFMHKYWYFDGTEEIAQALRVPLRTVYHRLARLKKDLYADLVKNGVFSS